jgi:hypothetical protein
MDCIYDHFEYPKAPGRDRRGDRADEAWEARDKVDQQLCATTRYTGPWSDLNESITRYIAGCFLFLTFTQFFNLPA